MKKSLYLIAALTLMGANAFATTTEIKEEFVNQETQILTTAEEATDKWSFTGRTYLETEDFDNGATIDRTAGVPGMKKLGSGADGTFWGTGISGTKGKLTLDLNVERRFFGDLNGLKSGAKNDATRVDYKVRYQLLENQGFHVKYRNEKSDSSKRDRVELGTDWNYFNGLFAGWLVIGHDEDKPVTGKNTNGNYWEGDFGPTFKLTEKLSLNPTIYTTGEFYDTYEMVETQLRIMMPYQLNEKVTLMPRVRITLDRTNDDKINGEYKRSYDQNFGNKIRYELMANVTITENLSTFLGVAYEDGKRDFQNSDIFGGANGKQDVDLFWTYVGLNYKFN